MKRSYANNRKTAILLAIAMMAAVFSVSKNAVASIAESGQYAVVTAGTLVKAGILADAENPGDPENPGGNENPGNEDPGNENPGNEDPGDITPGGEVTPSAEVTPSEELSPSPSPTNSPSPEPTPIPTTPPTPTDSPTPTVSPTPTLSPTPSPSPTPTPEGTAGYVNVSIELDVYNDTLAELMDSRGYAIKLTPGTLVRILGDQTISGKTYSKIKFDYNGQTGLVGYVSPNLLWAYPDIDDGDPEYIAYIAELKTKGFPDSYCESLYILHLQHPNWKFEAMLTGLVWSDVVSAQHDSVGKSLVNKIAPSSWKSIENGYYTWLKADGSDGGYLLTDGDNWHPASKSIISYCLDPRNFFSEKAIFMFEQQSYDPTLQTLEGVQNMLVGSHMEGSPSDGGGTYAEILVQAAQESGVSPYFLAARIFQEVGKTTDKMSSLITGQYSVFNYYNWGASAGNNRTAIENGVRYARGSAQMLSIGGNSVSDERPWKTRKAAIIGGAKKLGAGYIDRGQDTLYLQRFNVTQNSTYSNQYMTNVTAPYQEAQLYYQNLDFKKNTQFNDVAFVFKIPVYLDMPETKCARPVGDGNPNAYLKELTIDDEDLTPDFSYSTFSYDVVVGAGTTSVTINAKPIASTTKVNGTGKISIAPGENIINVDGVAENGNVIRYVIRVFRKETTETIISGKYDLTEERIQGVPLGTDVATFLSGITVTGSSKVEVINVNNEVITSGFVGTGCCLKTDDYRIPVIIYGDVTGDGIINAMDLLYIKRHMLGKSTLKGAAAKAADVRGNDGISAMDLLYVKRHMLGTAVIEQPGSK